MSTSGSEDSDVSDYGSSDALECSPEPEWYQRIGCSAEYKADNALTNDHIGIWLKTNNLINNSSEQMLKKCFVSNADVFVDLFSDLFGDLKKLMLAFIQNNHSNKENLEYLYVVIANYEETHIQTNNLSEMKTKTLNFESMPDQCISYVSGFLNKNDMFWFKLTSRRIAMLCLEEMKKMSVGIGNADSLCLKYERHNPNRTMVSLYDEWSKEYDIPIPHQLLFVDSAPLKSYCHSNIPCDRNSLRIFNGFGHKLKLFDSDKIKFQTIRQRKSKLPCKFTPNSFFIADRRNIIVLNQKGARKYDIEQDSFANLKDYKLLILRYEFSSSAHLVMCEYNEEHKTTYADILRYIENKFICLLFVIVLR